MDNNAPQPHIDTEDARAGSTPHVVRWVLGISLTLAVVAMSVVWIIPALTMDRTVDEVSAESGAATQ